MKKNKKEEEKVYSVEELAEFIKSSPLMKKEPKKPMSLFTKILIFTIITALALFIYFKFIYVPYVFTVSFEPKVYKFGDYTFITKDTNEVIFDTNYIQLDENISDILIFKDYTDMDKKYAIFLSNYGNLYIYDINEKNILPYYKGEKKIARIEERNLDIYDSVIEVTYEDLSKGIIAKNGIIPNSINGLKIMDKAIFSENGIYLYTYSDKVYIARYEEVSHFDLKTLKVKKTDKIKKSFFNANTSEEIEISNISYIKVENIIYIYLITKDGKLVVFKFDITKYDELPNINNIKVITFNSNLETFLDDIELKNGVRIKIENEDRYIDVIEDKIIYGSLSNDLSSLTYTKDIFNPLKYIITSSLEGNNKYKSDYYTLNALDKVVIVYVNMHSELLVTEISLKEEYENTKKVKLKENTTVQKLFVDNSQVYITVKEKTKIDYVVFENEVIESENTYRLSEYLKGVEYYE